MFSFFKKKSEKNEKIGNEANELTDMFTCTVNAILTAIDQKGQYTAGRSSRITYYAVKIAEQLNLSHEEISKIEVASMLHDIGMINIPDEVLYKNDKLTYDEYELIKQHVTNGIKVLKTIEQLSSIIPIIRHHHERWDGKGYPDGVSGEEIPIGSRIISLVDAYDSMVSDRAYRGALTHEAAVAEIKKHSGAQFDPHLVDVFDSICYDPMMGIETLEPDEYELEN